MSSDYKKVRSIGLLIAIITVIVYLPAAQNDFVNWDDPYYVYENPHIQSFDLKFLKWMLTAFHASNWHPLTWLSHGIDYALWGPDPAGHHLSSIILHGLNTFLIVLLSFRLIGSTKKTAVSFNAPLIAAAVTGLLFGLHPLHVESVAWVSERKDVLCVFFILLSIFFYLKYIPFTLRNSAQSPHSLSGILTHSRPAKINYGLCLLFYILALMSKPMAVTLPAVLIILDWYPYERFTFNSAHGSLRQVLAEKLPFLFFATASTVLTVMAHQSRKALVPDTVYPFINRFLIAVRSPIFYLEKIFVPVNLSPLYPYPEKISFFSYEYLGAAFLVLGITIFCGISFKKRKIWTAAWAFYIVTLLPVSGIIQIGKHLAADRYTYLPGIGPFMLIGLAVARLWEKSAHLSKKTFSHKLLIILPLILVFALLSSLTIRQIGIWKNSITLWDREIKLFPDNYYAYYCLGTTYDESGSYQQAIENYATAIKLNPFFGKTYNNLAITYSKLNNYSKSLENYNKAVELDPQYAEAYYNRGLVYLRLQKNQQAIMNFSKAVELDPAFTEAYKKRGETFLQSGMYRETLLDFNKALELNPEDAEIYNSLGIIYANLKNYRLAIENFKRLIKLRPQIIEAYNNLGIIYGELGDHKQAIENYSKAIEINPKATSVYFNRGLAYTMMGKYQEADRDFLTAARLGDSEAQGYLQSKGITW